MQLEDTQVGTRVRVQLDYRTPHRQGTVGTIKKRYGIPEYTTFEVLFADGQKELFWDHQLEDHLFSGASRVALATLAVRLSVYEL